MPLLLVLLGLLSRLHTSMGPNGFPQMVFQPIHLVGLAALVLSIIGGTKIQSSSSSSHSTGKECLEAGSIVFLLIFLTLAVLAILTAFKSRHVPSAERVLIFAGVGVLPVLCVRLVYTVATAFSSPGSDFYYLAPHVIVQALMQFAMEAIAIIIYSWAGLTVPKTRPANNVNGPSDVEEQKQKIVGDGQQQSGYAYQQRAPQPQPQRNFGGYRPSRMIRNALRN